MNVIEISSAGKCTPTLTLGKRGENLATEIHFDFSAWSEEFGSTGFVELYVKRKGDESAYPVTVTIDGTVAIWTVTATDTDIAGLGEAEFLYRVGETVVKSVVFGTAVEQDIGQPSETPPDPYETWLDALTDLAADTRESAQRAETAEEGAEAAQRGAEAAQAATEEALAPVVADVTELSTKSEYLSDSVMDDTIPFGIWDSTVNAGFNVVQTGNIITLSGTSSATAGQVGTKILICDHVQTWNAATDPASTLVYPIRAIAGHHYRIALAVVSGTRDAGAGTGSIIVSYGMAGTSHTGRALPIEDDYAELDFVSNGEPYQIRLRIARLMTVTDLVLSVTVRDITVEYIDEVPLPDSTNPVESGGVYSAIEKVGNAIGNQILPQTLPSYTANSYWKAAGSGTGGTAVVTSLNNWRAYDPIPVSAGDRFTITGTDPDSTNTSFVLLTDDDLKVVQRVGDRTGSVQTFSFVVAGGATKMLITQRASVIPTLTKTVTGQPGLYDFAGITIAIIGDSISTNGAYSATNPLGNVPEIVVTEADVGVTLSAYATAYDVGTTIGSTTITSADVGTEVTFTPVDGDETKMLGVPDNFNSASVVTWWETVSESLGCNFIPVCWSGASVSSHEGTKNAYKTSYAWHEAQVRKCGIRTPGTMTRTAPDMIIICRGTNDLSHTPYTRVTDYLDSFPSAYPETDAYDDSGTTRYDFAKALRLTVKTMRDAYPSARIVLCTLNYFKRLTGDSHFTDNGVDNWQKYNDTIREVADYEGCGLIDFAKDGLMWSNAANGYYTDSPNYTHPTTKGHSVMAQRALLDLMRINAMT